MIARHRKDFVEALQTMLGCEYTDASLYKVEAILFVNKLVEGESLADMFRTFAGTELAHADQLARQLVKMDVAPAWNAGRTGASDSIRETLRNHVRREEMACDVYMQILKLNEDEDFGRVIVRIMRDEREHLSKARGLLTQLAS